jgi:ATP-dependent RNA helicase DDX19/DBP5
MRQYKVRFPDEHTKTLVIKDKILELAEYLGKRVIFVRTRNSACILHRALVDIGYPITTTQGAVTPEDIDKIVQEFLYQLIFLPEALTSNRSSSPTCPLF